MIDYEIESQLRSSITNDERLLWTGKPQTGIRLQTSDAFIIPFSLMWCGFAIFWESLVTVTGAPLFFQLWGIPFVLVGLYMVFGRFFTDARKRKNTLYAITDKRIIIRSGLFNPEVKSINLKTLSDVTISVKSDGSGTITLGPNGAMYTMVRWNNIPGQINLPASVHS